MSKDKYNIRIEELFSNMQPAEPEPSGEVVHMLPNRFDDKHNHTFIDDSASSRSLAGWEAFLDGIHHRERIGYLFEEGELRTLPVYLGDIPSVPGVYHVPLMIGKHSIGKLQLEKGLDQPWTQDEGELIVTVMERLTQQMETLRLLEEASRSKQSAEVAFRRLIRQSGGTADEEQAILDEMGFLVSGSVQEKTFGYVYDQDGVQPVDPETVTVDSGQQDRKTILSPIRLDEQVAGSFLVEASDYQTWTMDDDGLVDTVAQRLAQQIGNLRLLEESRYYHNETENAIRSLTSESWKAYLESSHIEQRGFVYELDQQVFQVTQLPETDGVNLPLTVRDEMIGELSLDIPAVDPDDAADLLSVIGDRLSTHLEGLRLAEQREQALAETETLYWISAKLSTAQSLEEALTSVSIPAREAGAIDSRLFFVTLDEKGEPESMSLAAVWYPDQGSQVIPVNTHFRLADYPSYRLSLSNPDGPILFENILTDARLDPASREVFKRTGAQAVAVLPLTINKRWVGVIFINWSQPHSFSNQEIRLYATLSRQAAVVVNNRLLLEQTRKRAQELQTVAQVSTAASTILNPQELLQSVVDLTKSSFGLYHVQAYLHRPAEHILEVTAASGEVGRVIAAQKQYVVAESTSPVARAARERQVIIVNDTHTDMTYRINTMLPDVRSEIVIPMIVGDRLMGVFEVLSEQMNRFSRDDARIYGTLASQVGVALQNAELYAEQTATVERLRELDHLKSSFLANMSHELRTPLNSILGFADVLLLELDGPLNDLMQNDIRLIEKNGKHLLSLINDVLDMAKIEAGRMNLAFEKFMLRELLDETIDITGSLAREKGLYLRIEPDSQDQVEMYADRVRIRQVMINIISNAVKFTEKGGISIRAEQRNDKLRISVKDSGIGIPLDKLEMIFEEFSQVDTSTTRKVGGTGLGLPISRRLVEMHGGKLWAESKGMTGEGSMFIIELPPVAVKTALS